jgi:hypothetical protein
MAKARSLARLDMHAAKIVAVVLDAETGQVQHLKLGGDVPETGRVVRSACAAGTREAWRRSDVVWPGRSPASSDSRR